MSIAIQSGLNKPFGIIGKRRHQAKMFGLAQRDLAHIAVSDLQQRRPGNLHQDGRMGRHDDLAVGLLLKFRQERQQFQLALW